MSRSQKTKPAFLYTAPKTREMPSFLGFSYFCRVGLYSVQTGKKGALSGVYTPGQNLFPYLPETALRGPERVGSRPPAWTQTLAHVSCRGAVGRKVQP